MQWAKNLPKTFQTINKETIYLSSKNFDFMQVPMYEYGP